MAKQTISTRSQRNQVNRDIDKAAPVIASNVLRIVSTAVTQEMATSIANATVHVPVTPKTITYSFDTDPYNN